MNAYGFVLTSPSLGPSPADGQAVAVDPVAMGPAKSEEELHLEKFGLTWSLIESSGGSVAADRMKDILDCIDDDYFNLALRYSTASALLTWFTAAPETLRNSVFDRFHFKTLQTIRFDLINTALPVLAPAASANATTAANAFSSSLFATTTTVTYNRNRPSHFLALWLQKQALANSAFRLQITREVLSIIRSVVEKNVVLSDTPLDNETGETDATVKAEIVKVLLRILPHDAQSFLDALPDEEERGAIDLLVALDELAGDKCNSVGDEAADLVAVIAHSKDEETLNNHNMAMVSMLRRGRGQVFDIMKHSTHFFEAQSKELVESLGNILPNVGFSTAAKWLEDLAERDPASLVPHIGSLVDRIGKEVAEDQARIMQVMLSVGLVEPQGLLGSIRHTADQCLSVMRRQSDSSYYSLLIPYIKVLAAVGTWSEAGALQCMSAAALVARSLVSEKLLAAEAALPATPSTKITSQRLPNSSSRQEPVNFGPLSPDTIAASKRHININSNNNNSNKLVSFKQQPSSSSSSQLHQPLPPLLETEDVAATASQTSLSTSDLHTLHQSNPADFRLEVEHREVELALLELFNLLKDKCSYCNLLSKPTIAALTSMRDVDSSLVDNILDWNYGKKVRRGDRRTLLLHAGELYVMRHPDIKKQLQPAQERSWFSFLSPLKSKDSTNNNESTNDNGHNNSHTSFFGSPSRTQNHQIAPSPVSMTLSLSQTPQPPLPGSVVMSRRLTAVQEEESLLMDGVSPSYPQSSRLNNNNENNNNMNHNELSPRRLFSDNTNNENINNSNGAGPVLSFADFLARQQAHPTSNNSSNTATVSSTNSASAPSSKLVSTDVFAPIDFAKSNDTSMRRPVQSTRPLTNTSDSTTTSSPSTRLSTSNNNSNSNSNASSRSPASTKASISTSSKSPTKSAAPPKQQSTVLRWLTSPFSRSKAKRSPAVPTISETAEDNSGVTDTLSPSRRVAPAPFPSQVGNSVNASVRLSQRDQQMQNFGSIRGSFAPASANSSIMSSDLPSALQGFSLDNTSNSNSNTAGIPSMLFTPIAYSTRQ